MIADVLPLKLQNREDAQVLQLEFKRGTQRGSVVEVGSPLRPKEEFSRVNCGCFDFLKTFLPGGLALSTNYFDYDPLLLVSSLQQANKQNHTNKQ